MSRGDESSVSHHANGYNYNASEKSNYFSKHLTFSGDYIGFERQESKLYTHVIRIDDKL